MKKLILVFLMQTMIFAQTKLIAHKSHSGSNANFNLALNEDLFDINESNFGNPIPRYSLDSIRKVQDSVLVEYSSKKNSKNIKIDSVKKHPFCNGLISKDSVDKIFKSQGRKVKIIGFKSQKEINRKQKRTLKIKPKKDKDKPVKVIKESSVKQDFNFYTLFGLFGGIILVYFLAIKFKKSA